MEYIGFQTNKQGYTLFISDGYETYGGVPEPVTLSIPAADLRTENIEVTGSGKAQFKRLPSDYPSESVGSIQAKIRAGAAELKRRSVKATVGSLLIVGGARVALDLLVPGSGEAAHVIIKKTIKACEWIAESASDASLWCGGASGVGFLTEQATRVVRVYNFQLNIRVSGTAVSVACYMPRHDFKKLLEQLRQQEIKNEE